MWIFVAAVAGVALIIWRIEAMNDKLKTAITDLQAEVADETTKLASIKAFVQGVPALAAAAVADALAANDVEESDAADAVEAAKQAVSDATDDTLAAIDSNTPASETVGSVSDEAPADQAADQPTE